MTSSHSTSSSPPAGALKEAAEIAAEMSQGHARSQLSSHLAADVVSALGASILVSPFITVIDRGIMQNASGAMKMGDSVREGMKEIVTHPMRFARRPEFLMIWGLYASTYATANIINTVYEHRGEDSGWARFLGTTAVNMTLCIAKDREFTRMFGTTRPKALPTPTYLLFTVRDAGTIAASFNFPGPASQWMQKNWDMSRGKADFAAQMVCPAAVQFLSTPLHLLGLDLYNNPHHTVGEKLAFVSRQYWAAVGARIGRIGPAFGIGGVSNTAFRKSMRRQLAP